MKSFDEPTPDVAEDAFHLDDLFMLLDYYTLPGGDDWSNRFCEGAAYDVEALVGDRGWLRGSRRPSDLVDVG